MTMRPAALLIAALVVAACRTAPTPEDCPNPFHLAASPLPPALPVTPATSDLTATIIGTATDSNTGRGLPNAVIHLNGLGPISTDSTFARPDSTGAFSIAGLRPGRYRLTPLSINYLNRPSFLTLVAGQVDTLRAVLRRGGEICSVTMTPRLRGT